MEGWDVLAIPGTRPAAKSTKTSATNHVPHWAKPAPSHWRPPSLREPPLPLSPSNTAGTFQKSPPAITDPRGRLLTNVTFGVSLFWGFPSLDNSSWSRVRNPHLGVLRGLAQFLGLLPRRESRLSPTGAQGGYKRSRPHLGTTRSSCSAPAVRPLQSPELLQGERLLPGGAG